MEYEQCDICGDVAVAWESCDRCGRVMCPRCADEQREWYREMGECDDCADRVREEAMRRIAEEKYERNDE